MLPHDREAALGKELREARAEIERLRAALKEIRSLTARHDLPDAWKIADRALILEQPPAPKPEAGDFEPHDFMRR